MVKQGILYVSHGSRVNAAIQEAEECIKLAQKRVNVPLQEICYLEISRPSIQEGIESLILQGAERIIVVPVLLLSAGHFYKDIPDAVKDGQKRWRHVEFFIGKPLGVQDKIIDILEERIKETGVGIKSNLSILLVGRGSRNPQSRIDIELAAEKLKEKAGADSIYTCFLAACEPLFDQALRSILEKKQGPVIVLPYLWFTGILIQSMEKKVQALDNEGSRVVLCRYLGKHPNMIQALADRAKEALAAE